MSERDWQIEAIRQIFQRSEDLPEQDEVRAEELFLQAEAAAESLGLTDTEIRQIIASTIRDPVRRDIYTKLYIESPALPDETIFAHADRALGADSTVGLKAAIKRWQAQKALGFPADYKPGIVK